MENNNSVACHGTVRVADSDPQPAFPIQFCREALQSLMLTRRTPKSEKRLGRHPVQSDFKDNAVSISEGKLQQKEYEKCGPGHPFRLHRRFLWRNELTLVFFAQIVRDGSLGALSSGFFSVFVSEIHIKDAGFLAIVPLQSEIGVKFFL